MKCKKQIVKGLSQIYKGYEIVAVKEDCSMADGGYYTAKKNGKYINFKSSKAKAVKLFLFNKGLVK